MKGRYRVGLILAAAAAMAQVPRLGAIAAVVVAAMLVGGAVVGMRWSGRVRQRSEDPSQSFIGPLAAGWLALTVLPMHNFSIRSGEAATTSLGLQPLAELLLFMAVGVVAVLVVRTFEPSLERARPPIALFLLPIWIVTTGTWSATGPYALARGMQMFAVAMAAWATLALGRADRGAVEAMVQAFLRWFLRMTLVLIVLGVLLGPLYVPASLENLERFTWIGAHPNASAMILATALVIVLATPAAVLRLPRWVVLGSVPPLLVALYANESRTGWLCLAVGLLVIFVLKGYLTPLVRSAGTPLLGFAVVASLYFNGGGIGDYLLRGDDSESIATGNGRLRLWGIGFEALDTPLEWIGGLGYGITRTLFAPQEKWALSAHNSILAFLVTAGLIGVLLFAVIVIRVTRDLLVSRTWAASSTGIAVTSIFVLVLTNGLATDILAEPTLGLAVLNLVAAVAAVNGLHRQPRSRPGTVTTVPVSRLGTRLAGER